MSYRIQIDVYGDRDKDKEHTEKEERKSDKWVKRIVVAFLTLMFVFYTKELFTQVMMDGTKVEVKKHGDTTEYILKAGTIRVKGSKDEVAEATITMLYDYLPAESYTLSFSNMENWEHSLVTITNHEGIEVYKHQYNGFQRSMAKPSNNSDAASYKYNPIAALAFREITKPKVNPFVYALVCLLYIAELLSFKLWKWVFLRHKITWAIDRGTLPSHAYKQTLLISRFTIFMLILYLSAQSYVW